jgi:heat shock protein HtpX
MNGIFKHSLVKNPIINDTNTILYCFSNCSIVVNDVNNARNDVTDFQQIDFDGDGKITDEELRRLANSDVKISKKNGIMELFSTHPDSLKRVKRLAELEN